MEQINVGITKEKKEDLRVQIQTLQSEINELKQSGDKYGRLPEKQRYLEYLKKEWDKLNTSLGKTYNSAVRDSAEQISNEKGSLYSISDNVTINEEWAMNNHYKQMHELQKSIVKIDNEINREENYVNRINLQGKKSSLEKELEILKGYSKEDVIMFAKNRKQAYLDAKKRYQALSSMEKLKIKMSGKEITWDKIKDDYSYTTAQLEMLYQPRSR